MSQSTDLISAQKEKEVLRREATSVVLWAYSIWVLGVIFVVAGILVTHFIGS